jgi:hypothetical protein
MANALDSTARRIPEPILQPIRPTPPRTPTTTLPSTIPLLDRPHQRPRLRNIPSRKRGIYENDLMVDHAAGSRETEVAGLVGRDGGPGFIESECAGAGDCQDGELSGARDVFGGWMREVCRAGFDRLR